MDLRCTVKEHCALLFYAARIIFKVKKSNTWWLQEHFEKGGIVVALDVHSLVLAASGCFHTKYVKGSVTGLQHYLHNLSCSQKVKLKWLPGSTFGNWQGTSDLRVGKVFRRQEHKQIRIQHACNCCTTF